jgi:hypothetical protein
MAEAVTRGALQLKTAKTRDARWRRRRNLILDHLDRENARRLFELQHAQACAELVAGGREAFSSNAKNVHEVYRSILALAVPWCGSEMSLGAAARAMKAQYEKLFGKIDSPEFQAATAALVKEWTPKS